MGEIADAILNGDMAEDGEWLGETDEEIAERIIDNEIYDYAMARVKLAQGAGTIDWAVDCRIALKVAIVGAIKKKHQP